jgi:hypothetical protein
MIESRRLGPLTANVHKIILALLRFVLPVAALAYLIRTLTGIPGEVFNLWLSSLPFEYLTFMLLALLLTLAAANWLIEAVKWKILAGRIEKISLSKAFMGILYGVCLGFVTPRRSGEIPGRAMVLQPGNKVSGMLINTPGSMAQLGVTLVGGLASLVLILSAGTTYGPGPAMLVFPVLALLALVLLAVFAKPLLRRYLYGTRIPRWTAKAAVLLDVSRNLLILLTGLSLIRYMVFMAQFYLLLRIFQTPFTMQQSFILLSVTYLVLAAVPLSALGEAGVRGAVVLLVSGWMTGGTLPPYTEAGLVAGILGLWLVNLVFPALAGAALAIGGGVSLNLRRALS